MIVNALLQQARDMHICKLRVPQKSLVEIKEFSQLNNDRQYQLKTEIQYTEDSLSTLNHEITQLKSELIPGGEVYLQLAFQKTLLSLKDLRTEIQYE